ncbi:polysaccharide pyruvyl transferase family protein [Vibrio breoganii]
MKEDHSKVMWRLKNELNSLLEWIDKEKSIIFVDIPVYLNIGDLIIQKGTERFFKENEIDITLRLSDLNFDVNMLNDLYPNAIVICQGGGNFGDQYLSHQQVRDDLVEKYSGKIIMLPQSINFENPINLEKCVQKYKSKSNIYMCARDEYSYSLMKEMSDNVLLLPDMAHYIWNGEEKRHGEGVLWFIRNDIEASKDNEKYASKFSKDWSDDFTLFDRLSLRFFKLITPFCKGVYSANFIANLWIRYSNRKIDSVSKMFSQYDSVITSRLHGHILSALLSIPSKVVDNSYKKNSRYLSVWTSASDKTEYMD